MVAFGWGIENGGWPSGRPERKERHLHLSERRRFDDLASKTIQNISHSPTPPLLLLFLSVSSFSFFFFFSFCLFSFFLSSNPTLPHPPLSLFPPLLFLTF